MLEKDWIDVEIAEQSRCFYSERLLYSNDKLKKIISDFLWALLFSGYDGFLLKENVWKEILNISSISKEIRVIKAKIESCDNKLSSLKSVKDCSFEELEEQEAFFDQNLEEIASLIERLSKKANNFLGGVLSSRESLKPSNLPEKAKEVLDQRELMLSKIFVKFKIEFYPDWWTK